MPTIDMQIAMTVTVPDAAGVAREVELTEGLNDVPVEVTEHWYVRKFMRPVPDARRVVLPSAARPAFLTRQTIANMADALDEADEGAAAAAEPASMRKKPKG